MINGTGLILILIIRISFGSGVIKNEKDLDEKILEIIDQNARK